LLKIKRFVWKTNADHVIIKECKVAFVRISAVPSSIPLKSIFVN